MRKPFKKELNNYALYGALLGLMIPVVATMLESLRVYESVSLGHLLHVQASTYLLWVVDTAPLWIAVLARFTGERQDKLNLHMRTLEETVDERMRDLRQKNEELLQEIRERKVAEALLRDSEEKYRFVTENINDLISMVDTKGNYTFVNETHRRVGGYAPEELVGQRGFDFLHPDDVDRLASAFERAEEKRPTFEARFRCKDGSYRWLRMSGTLLTDEHGVPEKGLMIGHDITVWREADEALRESEKRFRDLVDMLPQLVFELDASGNLTYASRNTHEALGYTAEELLGRNSMELIVSEERQRASDNLAKLGPGSGEAKGVDDEYTAIRKDGSTFPVLFYSTPIVEDGQAIGLRGIAVDLTQRKGVEEVLKESEQGLRKAQQVAHVGSWEWNLADGSFRMSEEMRRIYGLADDKEYSSLQLVIEEHVHPDDAEMVAAVARDVVEGTRREAIKFRIVRSDGETRWVVTSSPEAKLCAPDGSPLVLMGTIQDITDRQLAEDALRESEQKFRELADLLPQTVFEVDMEGRMTYSNRCGLEAFGYTDVDLERGLNALEMILAEDQDRAARDMARVFAGEDPVEFEYTGVRKDGSVLPVLIYSAPIVKDSEVVGLRGIAVDITERKLAEVALREAHGLLEERVRERTEALSAANNRIQIHAYQLEATNEELRDMQDQLLTANRQLEAALDDLRCSQEQLLQSAKLAAIGELVSGVAHELKSPLAAISLASELLEDEVQDQESREDLRLISQQVERGMSLVENLLSFARKHGPKRELLSVNEVLESTLALVIYDLNVGNIRVVRELDSDLPMTMADFRQLQQVFLNLITNAQQAMKEANGRGVLAIHSEKAGDMIRVSVSDEGAGIPDEVMEKVFEAFFTTKEIGKGTGLGLSICKGIVEEHGGRVSVRSTRGEGATFIVDLPVVSEVGDVPIEVARDSVSRSETLSVRVAD